MGYTHYWRGIESKIDSVKWKEAIADCDKIISSKKQELSLDVEEDQDLIVFNGNEEAGEACETFVMPRQSAVIEASEFDFCKTRERPYDIIVTACLARLSEAGLQVASDGYEDDWKPGLDVCSEILSRPIKFLVEV